MSFFLFLLYIFRERESTCLTCIFIVGDISKIARTSSTGTMSSNEDEKEDEKDGNVTSFESQSKIYRLSSNVTIQFTLATVRN